MLRAVHTCMLYEWGFWMVSAVWHVMQPFTKLVCPCSSRIVRSCIACIVSGLGMSCCGFHACILYGRNLADGHLLSCVQQHSHTREWTSRCSVMRGTCTASNHTPFAQTALVTLPHLVPCKHGCYQQLRLSCTLVAGRAGARSVVFNHSASPFGFSIGRASEGLEQAPLFSTNGHRLVFKARGCSRRSALLPLPAVGSHRIICSVCLAQHVSLWASAQKESAHAASKKCEDCANFTACTRRFLTYNE